MKEIYRQLLTYHRRTMEFQIIHAKNAIIGTNIEF